jgi:antitoxin HicB
MFEGDSGCAYRERVMNKREVRESLKRRYRMALGFDAESDAWVVRYPELPGCLAHGATPTEALAEGEEAKALWLETAIENGFEIPTPRQEMSPSGKLVLRLPKTLHAAAAENAKDEGTSLNNYLVHLISEGVQRTGIKNLYAQIETGRGRPARAGAARRKFKRPKAAAR